MDTAILYFAAIGVLFTIAAIVFAVLSWRGRGITGILENELNEARQANACLRERLVTERLARQLEDARQMSENTTMEGVELGLSIEKMERIERLERELAEWKDTAQQWKLNAEINAESAAECHKKLAAAGTLESARQCGEV